MENIASHKVYKSHSSLPRENNTTNDWKEDAGTSQIEITTEKFVPMRIIL
jgi:hypothetical protein